MTRITTEQQQKSDLGRIIAEADRRISQYPLTFMGVFTFASTVGIWVVAYHVWRISSFFSQMGDALASTY